jgi:hypothetical protein
LQRENVETVDMRAEGLIRGRPEIDFATHRPALPVVRTVAFPKRTTERLANSIKLTGHPFRQKTLKSLNNLVFKVSCAQSNAQTKTRPKIIFAGGL